MLYECHITCASAQCAIAETVAKDWEWKTSSIADDPVLGKGVHFYLTAHFDDIRKAMSQIDLVEIDLLNAGVRIIRKKIEADILDVRY